MSTEIPTPSDVVKSVIRHFSRGEMAEGAKYYADDVEVAVQFALPERVIFHKDKFDQPFGQTDKPFGRSPMYQGIEVRDLIVHQTLDPNVVIAEWTYATPRDGGEVLNYNIIVVEVRDGKIVRSRDYHNHVMRAVADRTAGTLLDQLRGHFAS